MFIQGHDDSELPTIFTNNSIVPGSLDENDVNNSTSDSRYNDDYKLIDFTVGKLVRLYLSSLNSDTSQEFDTCLQLVNEDIGKVIAKNDDGYFGANKYVWLKRN